MKLTSLAFACLAGLSLVGCNRDSNSGNGPVAVVDLDAVAQKVGRDQQILQMIEKRQVSLNEQVIATQNSLIQQLNQKKSEFGDLSDEETKELAQLQNQANTILATTRTQAQSNLTSFQLEVVNRFRAEIRPIALELAAKKGCRVVLSKNDSVVFAFDSTVDLTDEVAAQLKSKTSTAQSTAATQPTQTASSSANSNPSTAGSTKSVAK